MAQQCTASETLVIVSMVNGHSNGVSLGSGDTGLDRRGRPCPTMYVAGVVSESLDAVFGLSMYCLIGVNQ